MKTRDRRFLTIKNEIFLLSFAFLLLVSVLFSGVFLLVLYRHNITGARNSLRECNSQIVTYTESMFHENASMADLLSRDQEIIQGAQGDPSHILNKFKQMKKNNKNITYVYAGYSNGRLLISDYDTPSDFNTKTRPWYTAAVGVDGVASLVYEDAASGVWMFSQSRRFIDTEGNVAGVVSIDCSNESITRRLSARYQYKSQRSFIVDKVGRVRIHPDEKEINASLLDYISGEAWRNAVEGRDNYVEYTREGKKNMAYLERIPDTDFTAVTAIDSMEITLPILRSMLYLLALIVCISIALGFILSRILSYRFARPIEILKDRIGNIASGKEGEMPEFSCSNEEMNTIAEGMEALVKDIARREEQRRAAEYLSFHDSMTGLYNRRFFDEELHRLDTKRNYPLCIICCDINGLKLVNDVFGHDAGDKLICSVAECLKRGCREDDILARTGGDEFTIVMPHTSALDAPGILNRLKEEFAREYVCGVKVSASLGYAVKLKKEQSVGEIIRNADKMMYAQKMTESYGMKQNTLSNIFEMARAEGIIKPLSQEEERLLDALARKLCPDALALLKESYRLRNLGRSNLFITGKDSLDVLDKRHTEMGYRILSAFDEFRGAAGCILHYTEHWDGSGWPAGLSGPDIPLLSRVIAVADAYFEEKGGILTKNKEWFDPEILECLLKTVKELESNP